MTRNDFPALFNKMGLVGEGVEVGVLQGEFSFVLLSGWWGRKLHLVDRWTAYPKEEFTGTSPVQFGDDVFERFYRETLDRVAWFGDRVDVMRMESSEAAGRFGDGTLDFVYVDANHAYQYVRRDLEAWFPKVRPGGVVAGHDYRDGQENTDNFGVKRAVDEFAAKLGTVLSLTEDEPKSWFFVKTDV